MTRDGKTPGKTTWGDVVAASAEAEAAQGTEQTETREAVPATAVPATAEQRAGETRRAGETLRPGDTVRHEKFGDCTVHRITENYQFVHMAVPNGKVRRLSLAIVEFTFDGIEGGRRIFRTSVKKTS